jgi:hypothetical protein
MPDMEDHAQYADLVADNMCLSSHAALPEFSGHVTAEELPAAVEKQAADWMKDRSDQLLTMLVA